MEEEAWIPRRTELTLMCNENYVLLTTESPDLGSKFGGIYVIS